MHARHTTYARHTFARVLAIALASVITAAVLVVPAGSAQARYTPKPGATFNNPVAGAKSQRTIFRKVIKSINSTPRKGSIEIFSWNFLTREGKAALLRAQRRGVRVRLLMDDRNNTEIPNQPYRRLRAGLRRGNRGRPAQRHSWARVCHGSCRGATGSAHSKFFLFSKVGRARDVFIQGSANFTVASTTNQWNDVTTHVNNKPVYDWARNVFSQAAQDKKAPKPYLDRSFGTFRLLMFPNTGSDPVMGMLKKVKCRGARNGANGRTVLRIAPDVWRNPRGNTLARKVRNLWENGCNIRVGYTVMGIDTGRILRDRGGRGPVPMKHLVQDTNRDGEFDNYFHLKSMSIRGHYGNDRSGLALLNGSANWSGLAKVSDENLGIYRNPTLVRKYEDHINYWYNRFPGSSRQRLVFGSGANARYENGDLVGDGTTNPFAKVETD